MARTPAFTRAVRAPLALSNDWIRRRGLMRKYVEYLDRCGYPAVYAGADADIVFRCMLLERLLFMHVVDLTAFEAECAQYAWFNKGQFDNAVGVVSSYNNGQQVQDGTGFK